MVDDKGTIDYFSIKKLMIFEKYPFKFPRGFFAKKVITCTDKNVIAAYVRERFY